MVSELQYAALSHSRFEEDPHLQVHNLLSSGHRYKMQPKFANESLGALTQGALSNRFFKTAVAVAAAVTIAVMVAAIFGRPLWRDEFWALFFSDPDLSTVRLIDDRLRMDVHPPLYFLLLNAVRRLIDDPLVARLLNLVFLSAALLISVKISPQRRTLPNLFLFLCLTSYWAVFFVAEVRPYALLYATSIVWTLAVATLTEDQRFRPGHLLIYLASSIVLANLHYFGAAMVATTSLALGVYWLFAGVSRRFFVVGALAVTATLPSLGWIAFALPTMSIDAGSEAGYAERFSEGLEQFLRGLVVKTAGSNLPAAGLAAVGLIAAGWRLGPAERVLALGALACVGLVFALHVFWTPLIKERAFIVVMPAFIWIISWAVLNAKNTRHNLRVFCAIPIAAILAPSLFFGEHFKDREDFTEVQRFFALHPPCEQAHILAFYRTFQHPDYYRYFTSAALTGRFSLGGGPALVDAASPEAARFAATPDCPILAVAVGLRRGDDALRERARGSLQQAGLRLDSLTELQFAEGRHLIFVRPQLEAEP